MGKGFIGVNVESQLNDSWMERENKVRFRNPRSLTLEETQREKVDGESVCVGTGRRQLGFYKIENKEKMRNREREIR